MRGFSISIRALVIVPVQGVSSFEDPPANTLCAVLFFPLFLFFRNHQL